MGYDKPFNVNQDRTIDPLTAQMYCVGCPYKGIKPRVRGSGGNANSTNWDASQVVRGNVAMQTEYICKSPNYNFKTMLRYQMSSTMGGGYCPFFLDKWKLRESNTDPDDPPINNKT